MQQPNILWITSDQQHWSLLGCLNPAVKTPNLDRLAAQGTLFHRAYCPNPTCTPTRASMITGLYPDQHGAYSLGTRLDEKFPTLGDSLAGAGYRTSLVGKAHFQPLKSTEQYPSLESYPVLQDLEFWRKFNGPFYGFQQVELARNHTDEAHVGQHYAIWMEERGAKDWRQWFAPPTGTTPKQTHRWNIPVDYHYNTWITERSTALIEQAAARRTPFFHWASYFDPHPSYLVPEPWASMYSPDEIELPPQPDAEEIARMVPPVRRTREEKPDFSEFVEPDGNAMHGFGSHRIEEATLRKHIAIYYGMMSFLDHSIGQLLDNLDRLGMAESTLVVFTTDHGHYFGQHGLIAKGSFHHEDAIRVPFIARMPGQIPAAAESRAIQSLVDLPQTCLAACGVETAPPMAGVNQWPVWTGQAESARSWAIVENRHQPRKLVLKTLVTDNHKLTVWRGQEYGELYDLVADPGETRNLWDDPAHAGLRARMLLELVNAEMDSAVVPMPRISVA